MPPYNSTDPTATFLNVSCLDFLLIELVPLAYRITNELEPPSEPSSTADTSSTSPASRRLDEEERREAAAYRLDMLGYRVGQGLVERLVMPTMVLGSLDASISLLGSRRVEPYMPAFRDSSSGLGADRYGSKKLSRRDSPISNPP